MKYSWRYRPNSQPGQQASTQDSAQESGQDSPPASPKAPDMSAYAQPSGGYNASNVPRTAPEGARANNLSGQVPSNQIWAQAYNQAAKQYGGNTQAQSWTMPGSYTSQSYNPTTGQYGQPTGGQSFDGNMAYNAIDSRPSPITSTATGVGGVQMPWQDTMAQREAFAGNLSQRLGQYNAGQLTGPVTFDQNQLLSQANDQLANGTFYNPFSQQNPEVKQAMGNATQYMQGDFQNPFGQKNNNQQPSWEQPNYNPDTLQAYQPGSAQPKQTQSLGTAYAPSPTELPEPPKAQPARPTRFPWRSRPHTTQQSAPVTDETPPGEEAPPAEPAPPVAPPTPKPRAPIRAPANMVIVPPNRRGSANRLGGMRHNGW